MNDLWLAGEYVDPVYFLNFVTLLRSPMTLMQMGISDNELGIGTGEMFGKMCHSQKRWEKSFLYRVHFNLSLKK